MSQRENLFVRRFAYLREHVKSGHEEKVSAPRVPWRQKQRGKQREQCVKLDCGVEAQIASALLFRPTPLKHASYTDCYQHR
jgi:hypothetical protein